MKLSPILTAMVYEGAQNWPLVNKEDSLNLLKRMN